MIEPCFAELYVVSDLHLGDTKGQPIFDQAGALASFIRYLAGKRPAGGGPLGLVLNGDVFDTLPEAMKGYVCDRDEAERAIEGIFTSPLFAAVFEALRTFVASPEHRLLFVLGNHDLELIYPNVQELLLAFLVHPEATAANAALTDQQRTAELEARRGRVTFATAGTGFRCRVGASAERAVSVACVHGNEFDDWNAFDPETLTRLARAGTLGRESALTRVAPNSGTRLVRDVMNGIKAKYPFVDLLKPEDEGVFTILLAIAPDELKRVPGFLRSLMGSITVGAGRTSRVLGSAAKAALTTSDSGRESAAEKGTWAPSGAFAAFLDQGVDTRRASNDLLQNVWDQTLDDGVRPEDLAAEDAVLGKGQLVLNLLDYYVRRIAQNPQRALRAALEDWGGSPETFALQGQCPVYDALAKLEPDVDVIVAGHTHLRRQKRLPAPPASARSPLYLNTGTWIRLLALSREALGERFTELLAALASNDMAKIDALGPSIVLRQTTVAVIRPSADGLRVEAAICEFEPAAAEGAERLRPVQVWDTVSRG